MMLPLIGLENIGSLGMASSGLMHSSLVHHLVSHEIAHVFFSLLKGPRKVRLTRSQRRKLMNRRRRWFTDNIIMHHKRLHDRNREIVVSSARSRSLAKKLVKKVNVEVGQNRKWREKMDTRDRVISIRGMIDARRNRARSRWLSMNVEHARAEKLKVSAS